MTFKRIAGNGCTYLDFGGVFTVRENRFLAIDLDDFEEHHKITGSWWNPAKVVERVPCVSIYWHCDTDIRGHVKRQCFTGEEAVRIHAAVADTVETLEVG